MKRLRRWKYTMKLSLKLPLSFALALGLLFLGALFGIFKLNDSLEVYEHEVLITVAAQKKASQIDAHFSTAIQEWKNVLLRGKDPKDLDRYWTSHLKEMKGEKKWFAGPRQDAPGQCCERNPAQAEPGHSRRWRGLQESV